MSNTLTPAKTKAFSFFNIKSGEAICSFPFGCSHSGESQKLHKHQILSNLSEFFHLVPLPLDSQQCEIWSHPSISFHELVSFVSVKAKNLNWSLTVIVTITCTKRHNSAISCPIKCPPAINQLLCLKPLSLVFTAANEMVLKSKMQIY